MKFHIGERSADGGWRKVVDRAETTRLGDGLQETGRLNPEPMDRTVEAIAEMAEEARQHRSRGDRGGRYGRAADRPQQRGLRRGRAGAVRCAPSRSSPGSRRATSPTSRRWRGSVRCPGRESSSTPAEGARSSRSAFGDRVDERFSVEWAPSATPSGTASTVSSPRRCWPRRSPRSTTTSFVSTADPRPTCSSRWAGRSPTSPRSSTVWPSTTRTSCRGRCSTGPRSTGRSSSTARSALDERRQVVGLQPQRADIILAGACIVRTVLGKLGKDSLTVSDRGLRHGVLEHRFAPTRTAE